MAFDFNQEAARCAVIKVMGIGTGGIRTVNHLVQEGLVGVDFVTLSQGSPMSVSERVGEKIVLRRAMIQGRHHSCLGVGKRQDFLPIGGTRPRLFPEDEDAIQEALESADMLLLVQELDGSASPLVTARIAEWARDGDRLTVVILTTLPAFQGDLPGCFAEEWVKALLETRATVAVLQGGRMIEGFSQQDLHPEEVALLMAEARSHSIRLITEIITEPGLIGTDFADVRTILSGGGPATIGVGIGHGEYRAEDAARMALNRVQQQIPLERAGRILLWVSGSSDMGIHDVNRAASLIQEAVPGDANIIMGAVVSESFSHSLAVGLLATGFGNGPGEHLRMLSSWVSGTSGRHSGRESGAREARP